MSPLLKRMLLWVKYLSTPGERRIREGHHTRDLGIYRKAFCPFIIIIIIFLKEIVTSPALQLTTASQL